MSHKTAIVTCVVVTIVAGAAQPAELREGAAQSITLGDVTGVAYYTVEDDGYRVVATMSVHDMTPVRFISTLSVGQQVVLSVPGVLGTNDTRVTLTREVDRLVVSGGGTDRVLTRARLNGTE